MATTVPDIDTSNWGCLVTIAEQTKRHIAWLYLRHIEGFTEEEARQFLESTPRSLDEAYEGIPPAREPDVHSFWLAVSKLGFFFVQRVIGDLIESGDRKYADRFVRALYRISDYEPFSNFLLEAEKPPAA